MLGGDAQIGLLVGDDAKVFAVQGDPQDEVTVVVFYFFAEGGKECGVIEDGVSRNTDVKGGDADALVGDEQVEAVDDGTFDDVVCDLDEFVVQ